MSKTKYYAQNEPCRLFHKGLLFALVMVLVLGMTHLSGSAALSAESGEKPTIKGAGATFPMPIYHDWAKAYKRRSKVNVEYRGIGSSGGIRHIKAKTVDFGGSDKPLSGKELEKAGLAQFPMIMGGVVPVINVKGVRRGKLKLTPELLSGIFMGDIKKWNDRRMLAVNPRLKLPDEPITVVHRADGSGTTWIFTNYMSKVSPEWKEKVGAGKKVPWPVGLGGKGNPGVAEVVKKTEGSMGYTEFAYALKNRLNYVQLQNQAGRFVKPAIETFQSAAVNADWTKADSFAVDLNDQPGDKTWPIVGTSYIMIYKDQPDKEKAITMLKFFQWCLKKGQPRAVKHHYVPMPQNVIALVNDLWKKEIVTDGQPIWAK